LGISVDLKAKRDKLIRKDAISLRDGAGAQTEAGFSQVGSSTSDSEVLTASALPRPRVSERASVYLPGARPPHTSDDGLDAFRSLVVRARVGRIMRERANLESRRLADQILSALEDGPLSRTAIGDRFFRYTNRNDIGEVLRTLQAAGFVVSKKIDTDGRPIEMWRRLRAVPRAEVNGA
jgi:hypothetical protein